MRACRELGINRLPFILKPINMPFFPNMQMKHTCLVLPRIAELSQYRQIIEIARNSNADAIHPGMDSFLKTPILPRPVRMPVLLLSALRVRF